MAFPLCTYSPQRRTVADELIDMKRNVADAGQLNFNGSDVTTSSLSNKSTTSASRRRTALHYDSESSSCNAVGDGAGQTTCSDRTDSILSNCTGHSDDILPPVSTLFADREAETSKVGTDQMTTTTATTKQATIVPQINAALLTADKMTPRKPPPAARKRPPRVRKQSKRSRASRAQNIQLQQQQQQNGLLLMQKLLGSMTSLLRRDVAPLITSFPVVTCSQRSPAVQSLPLSMFCAGAIGRQMPCGLLARPNLLTPSGTGGPLMAGAVRSPLVRPVVWPSMVAGGTASGRRAPATANASTSAPLLAGSRSARQKTSSATEETRGGARTGQPLNRLELMTVAALRDECRRLRLPTGGPKPNLVRRLQQNNFDASLSCVSTTTSYVTPSQTPMSIAAVQSAAEHRPSVAAPPPVILSSTPKSSSPTTAATTTSNEARASLSQSQAIVARILSIRAAQRQRNAELAAVATSTALSSSSSSPAGSNTSTAAVSIAPVTAGPPPAAQTLEVLTATSRTTSVSAATPLPQLNQAASASRTLPSAAMSSVNIMNGTQSVSNMMALPAYQQQQLRQLSQNLGRPLPPDQGREEPWRSKETDQTSLVGQQQELGQGRQVKVGHEDLLRVRDAESQVTLCRQQQMLIYELRRQLEQSRRALIEAQAGELKMAAEPPRQLAATHTSGGGQLPPSPAGAQTSADTQPGPQISAGSLHYSDIVPPETTCSPGLSFSLQGSQLSCSSAASILQQPQQQQHTVCDGSLSPNHRFTPLHERDIQFSLQPNQHT